MTIPEIKDRIIPVLKEYGVKKASLFGSIVKGECTTEIPDVSSIGV